ncbi:MAG: hypothetical protein ACLP01_10405 [Solirubrobacteraceae bacterium]
MRPAGPALRGPAREVVTLGTDADGWTMRKAERALEQILAEIQVGVWWPPSMSAGGEDPSFHEFESRWWVRAQAGAAAGNSG